MAWRADIAGPVLARLRQRPPVVARVLGAICQRSPDHDLADAIRVIRHVNHPVGLGTAFGYLPQPLAIALLDEIPHEQAVAILEKMDPAMVAEMRSARPQVLAGLLKTVRPGFLTQVSRQANR